MSAPTGFAIVLDGAGGIRAALDIDGAPWRPVPEPAVIVLNSVDPRAAAWITDNAGLDPAQREALLGPVRRTWGAAFAQPGEKVAVLVLEPVSRSAEGEASGGVARIIASQSRLVALADLTQPTPMLDRVREALRAGRGPRSPAELFIEVARFWNEHYLGEALELADATTALEDRSFEEHGRNDIATLHQLRRAGTLLRRRAGAHRVAVACVGGLEGTELVESHPERWRTLMRQSDEIVELIETAATRLETIDDHVQNQLSTTLGDRLYVLTLISAIFMPLSFITGLLGVNIGGLPLRERSWGFALLCLALIALAMGQYWVARRMNWLPRQDPMLIQRQSRGLKSGDRLQRA